jgi:hypothetical protein
MQKKTVYLLLSIIVIIAIFFFLYNKNISTLAGNEKDFGYKNTNQIDKIFITNKANKEFVTLTKSSNKEWRVNDKFEANWSQIDIILQTLRTIQVKKPVSNAELETVKRNLSLSGTKVEIYENGHISKTFYVGGNTGDEMGTYFYMDNAKEPYVCHIPGFNGYLSTRFFTNLNAWRSKNIFKCTADNISHIKMEWLDNKEYSYEINNSEKLPQLIANGKVLENNTVVNTNKLKSYLNNWENLSYEGFPIDLTPQIIDTIAKSKPMLIISLTDKQNKTTTLTIHRKGTGNRTSQKFDEKGNPLTFELENFYAFVNDNKTEIVQIQDFVFGKVMKIKNDFLMTKK